MYPLPWIPALIYIRGRLRGNDIEKRIATSSRFSIYNNCLIKNIGTPRND
jgi:hypothetical protein